MEINQDTLNYLYKEMFAIAQINQKNNEELNDLYQYCCLQEAKLCNQFQNYHITNENEIKLVNRFIARISETYQLMIAKRQIQRSQESKFQITIFNCLTQSFDNKNGILCQLIQAIYQECKLQIELLTNKIPIENNKRIHSQDNYQNEKLSSQYYSVQVSNKKTNLNEWQINIKNNKKLNNYYSKQFPKLYDVMSGIEKTQDEQILYFQSRDQNQERIYNQLVSQNQHIKLSLNWAGHIDPQNYNQSILAKQQKIKQIEEYELPSAQSSPIKKSQQSNQSIKPLNNNNKPTSPLKIINTNTQKMPQINTKFRSISQNVPLSETHIKNQPNLFIQQTEEEKITLFTKIMNNCKLNQFQINKVKIEFKPRKQPCSVLKSKMMIDLIPLHSSKLKPRGTRTFMQQI